MAIIKIKKHVDDAGIEYICASDVLAYGNEFDDKIQKAYEFLMLVEKELNYFCNNTSTAFGNPDLARAEGKVTGYCMAKGWDWEEANGIIRIKKGYRTLFVIERPAIPSAERERRIEMNKELRDMGL